MTDDLELPERWYDLRHHEQQAAAYRCTKRFIIGLAGRRSGKTEILGKRKPLKRAIRRAVKGGRYIWCAPTLDQAVRIYWDDLKDLTPPWLIKTIRESKNEIELLTGVKLIVAGMDKPQRIEGQLLLGIVLDEMADMKKDAWSKTVRPALDTPGFPGWAIIIGKAKLGAVHYRRLCDTAQKDDPEILREWAYFHWTSATVLTPEAIASAKRDLDPLSFAAEYEASWVTAEGRAYYPFIKQVHVRRDLHYDPYAPLILCFDFNVEPGSAVICQEQEWTGKTNRLLHPDGRVVKVSETFTAVLDEVHIPRNSNTPAVCRAILAKYGEHKGKVKCYGDPTGGNRGTSKVEGSDWDLISGRKGILKRHFGSQLITKVKKGAGPERPRINALNKRLLDADDHVSMFVHPDAECTIRDLENVILLKGGSGELDKKADDELTHWSDGLGYYCESEHPIYSQEAFVEEIF